ncbi:MAG: DoxX family protein [Myxococcota bacterium]|nr:DoxX family protein [Myxococcota bacterium]
MGFLQPYQPQIYAVLRIIAGLMFMQHGLQKVFGLFGGRPDQMPAPMLWTAGLIELVGGAMIGIGLFAPAAAFVAAGMMAVAYFMVHQPQGLLPIVNRGELAALYCWVFLLIAAKGSGVWSVDAARGTSSDGAGGTSPVA